MPRILMRSGKNPDTALTPEASLAATRFAVFGRNSGNLLFSTSVTRMLSVDGTEVVSDSLRSERSEPVREFVDRVNNEFDAFVLPMANAFRPQFVPPMRRLTRLIQQLKIPVVVVGVGAQLPVAGDVSSSSEEVQTATKDFVAAVLERSASIGVRGEVTERYLRELGFPSSSVDVVGCPSVYDVGPGFALQKRVDAIRSDSSFAFNTALTNRGAGAFVRRMTERYPNAYFIGQSNVELALLLWGTEIRGHEAGLPTSPDHPLFTEDRLRFFVDPSTWIDFLRERDFSIGARIHGNIAAILAGTPAVVLAADSRTLELADYHGIPYRVTPDLDRETDVSAIYDETSFDEFNRRVPENFDRYVRFLDRNGLPHISEGSPPAAFDRRMRAVDLPAGVRPPVGPDAGRMLLERLRWLRQDDLTDAQRRASAYVPPISPGPEPTDVERLEQRVAELERHLRVLTWAGAATDPVRLQRFGRRHLERLGARLSRRRG